MIKIGLTGSIGMGKSTTAALFEKRGAPVHDADAAVARLYAAGGAATPWIAEIAPSAIVDGAVDRGRLRDLVTKDPTLLKALEAAVHPLVTADRDAFAAAAVADGRAYVVFDVPLLFETGADAACDVVVVVTTSAEIQRQRVLARPGMTMEVFERILARQTPDAEKRARADYIVDTSVSIDDAERQVVAILNDLDRRREDMRLAPSEEN